jgi:hypothetical protein
MPRKDAANAVLGMLSNVGAQTRPADREAEAPAPTPAPQPRPEPAPAPAAAAPAVAVRTLPPAPAADAGSAAPRTLRLRTSTAAELREAWLEAKRDDVLLTAQDFASNLIEDALRRHRRRRTADVG